MKKTPEPQRPLVQEPANAANRQESRNTNVQVLAVRGFKTGMARDWRSGSAVGGEVSEGS